MILVPGRRPRGATFGVLVCALPLTLAGHFAARTATDLGQLASEPNRGNPATEAEASPHVTLLESAPVETDLGHADIPDFADVWLELIGGAKEHIELAHFYASDVGELGASDPEKPTRLTPVIAALEAAAKRGVHVRFLADAKFAKTYPALLERFGKLVNFEVRAYSLPSIEVVDYAPGTGLDSEYRVRLQPLPDGPRPGVMHAKYMLVDGKSVALGSANFDWRALEHIQELGVLLQDAKGQPSLVAAFADVFALDWFFAGGGVGMRPEATFDASTGFDWPATFGADSEPVRVTPVFSPRGLLPDETSWDLPRLVERIDAAKERVWVQVLTYHADDREGYFETLDGALRRAAGRGVDVRLMVADWGKRAYIVPGLKSLAVMPHIAVRFVTIPEATTGHIPFGRVIHSKYLVVDQDRAWVGTSNWERGYFTASRNVGLLLDGEAPARRLAKFFLDVWDSALAEPVDPGANYVAPEYGERD